MTLQANVVYPKPQYNLHRSVTGAPVVPDTSVLATLLASNPRTPINCQTWDSVNVLVKLTGGSTPTIAIEPLELVRYPDYSDKLVVAGAAQTGLGDGALINVVVYGGMMFFRISAVGGSPTGVDLYVAGAARSLVF